jgi:hypothetical protein
LRDGERERERE